MTEHHLHAVVSFSREREAEEFTKAPQLVVKYIKCASTSARFILIRQVHSSSLMVSKGRNKSIELCSANTLPFPSVDPLLLKIYLQKLIARMQYIRLAWPRRISE
jgi:hypothetical protein